MLYLCYQKLVIGINSKTQARKGLISYYKTNGITSLKKHVDVIHIIIVKMFEEEVNSLLKRKEEKQPTKKITIMSDGSIFNFIYQRFLKKKGCATERIFRRLGPFDYQKKFTNSICGKMWLKHLILRLCPKLNFLSKR